MTVMLVASCFEWKKISGFKCSTQEAPKQVADYDLQSILSTVKPDSGWTQDSN